MRYCADTWFILALFSNDATARSIISDAKTGRCELIIPVVVYTESIKKLMQRGIPTKKILDFFDMAESSRNISVVPIDRAIAREAATVSLTYAVPLIDAFVAATCRLLACHVLLTADRDYSLLAKHKYIKTRTW